MFTKPSPAFWRGRRGINLRGNYAIVADGSDPLGFNVDVYKGYATAYTPTGIANIAAAGFDYVRCVVRAEPLLEAQYQGNSARVASYLADIKTYFIDPMINAGFTAIFDLAPSPSHPTWGNPLTMAGKSASDPKFVALTQLVGAIATALSSYSPTKVALELINEPVDEISIPGLNAAWTSTLCKVLFDTARAADPRRTLIVSGTDYGSIAGLVGSTIDSTTALTGLNPAQFDSNTLYSFHHYNPIYFTHCGYIGFQPPASYVKYFDAMSWPFETNGVVDATARDAAIALAQANIDADGALSAGQKTSYKAAVATQLTNAYGTLGTAWSINPNTGSLKHPAKWADKYGVDRSQLICGEFGAHMGTRGVTQAGRDNWYRMVRESLESQNIRWSPWNWEETVFGIGTTGTVLLSTRQALGLA